VVVSGATTGANPPAELNRLFFKQISVIGVSGASRLETEQMLHFMEASDLHPVIDSVFSFADMHHAFERAQAEDLYGKVVVRVGER
jgi:D-arabinose 1-dehydrogenase-like Zn-dependent alcohol dehydrogenase